MLKRSGIGPLAARAVTSPFAVFVSWTVDLSILILELRRQRRRVGS